MPKQFYALSAFQNGSLALFEVYAGRKRLPLQNQIERCLLLCAIDKTILKIQNFVESAEFSLRLFWSWLPATNFYQPIENSSTCTEKTEH